MSKDLEFALELAQSADEISLSRFRALDLKVETKPDRTPVTDADKAVEERLREMISDYSPTDAVIGIICPLWRTLTAILFDIYFTLLFQAKL